MKRSAVKRSFTGSFLLWLTVWTGVLAVSLAYHYLDSRREMLSIARSQASEAIRKDLIFRLWAARHGGVYAPVTEDVLPNPYMNDVKERDVTTPSGKLLTLINPAYMTRQVHELARERFGDKAHLTSSRPLNPQNAPDAWEAKALRALEQGADDYGEILGDGDEGSYRLMKPMFVEAPCLKCHARQGYRVGELRGGLSTTVSLAPLAVVMREKVAADVRRIVAIWLIGLAALATGGVVVRRRERERELAVAELAKSEERFRSMVNTSLEGILTTDGQGGITYLNSRMTEMLGFTEAEMLGRQISSFIHETKQPEYVNQFDLVRRGVGTPVDCLFCCKDGRVIDVVVSASPLKDEAGDFRGVCAMISDVTERKRAEDALRESEERWRVIVQNEPECIKLLDREGRLLEMNPAGLAMMQATFEQVSGHRASGLVVEEDRPKFDEMVEAVFRGEKRSLVFDMVGLQGRRFTLETTSVPIFEPAGGTVKALLGVTRDITDQKRLEAQLRQSQKMEAIGQLAGGVAHDFNNLLQVITTYGFLIQQQCKEHGLPVLFVDEQMAAARRAVELTGALLTFSRKKPLHPKPVDLNRVLSESRKLLKRVIGEDITFEVIPASHEIIVRADDGEMLQVLMNLATNARDAMPRGGSLTISAAMAESHDPFLISQGCSQPRDFALITATDSGDGVAPEDLPRIFEPFFTTKEPGKGTGLGLAIIYGIVRQHNGFIQVESAPGKGTSFRVYLPLFVDEAAAGQKLVPIPPPRGSGTILLVEDEFMVRRALLSIMSGSGYAVLEAADGEEAVRVFGENVAAVDLVVMDMIMPKKNGWEALKEIRKIKPEVRNIFLSGYTGDVLERMGLEESTGVMLKKPVEPHVLLEAIRDTLSP